ncbi:16S rRNA (cytidine(1402)-2'-O)-methyltransferase [Helicobacter sp. T3_23-1059]
MLRFIPTPLGNLKDITLRSLEHLATAQVILCEDTRVAKSLLKNLFERFERDSRLLCEIFCGTLDSSDSPPTLNPNSKRFISLHSHNQKDFISTLTPDFFAKEVAYISDAGMPSICDPGALLIQYMQEHNLCYDVLVGGCALSVAFCFSGFAFQGFVFGGFLPHKPKERAHKLQECANATMPIIWYESPHRILDTLNDIARILPATRVFAIKEISKIYQRHFLGSADEILSMLSKNTTKQKSTKNYDDKILQGEWVVILEPSQNPSEYLKLSQNDIIALEIPPKIKAKMLSSLTGKDTKEIYSNLIKKQNLKNKI